MKNEKRKNYEHETLMEYLNLSHNDLPTELQQAIEKFDSLDAKIAGYQPDLEPASKTIASDIREWYDEEEDELPFDDNERACYIAFYVVGVEFITPQDFKKYGGNIRLNPKQGYKIGNKYQLKPEGKQHKIVSLQEQD
jgi:hypothetical protein